MRAVPRWRSPLWLLATLGSAQAMRLLRLLRAIVYVTSFVDAYEPVTCGAVITAKYSPSSRREYTPY